MAKFVRNPDGGIHSVPDDFELPDEWEEVSGKDVPAAVRGSKKGEQLDDTVNAVNLHDQGYIDDPNGTNPGVVDVPSSGEIGVAPAEVEEVSE